MKHPIQEDKYFRKCLDVAKHSQLFIKSGSIIVQNDKILAIGYNRDRIFYDKDSDRIIEIPRSITIGKRHTSQVEALNAFRYVYPDLDASTVDLYSVNNQNGPVLADKSFDSYLHDQTVEALIENGFRTMRVPCKEGWLVVPLVREVQTTQFIEAARISA